MRTRSKRLVWAALLAAGCVTDAQFLQNRQWEAVQTASSRARFEMNCQEIEPTVLSSEVVPPPIEGPLVAGVRRAEYTIGISGCGKRQEFIVLCPDEGGGCFAARPDREPLP
jgi:hypothetical protein